MANIKLLDCTLRDGGYINDWGFGHDNMVSIFERVVEANTDFIEIGFLDERRQYDFNKSIMPNTACVDKIYGNLDKKGTQVLAMIDYGTCGIENIKRCEESFIDGIRVIFKKKIYKEALAFCGQLKKLGYKVFAQLVSVTSYSDEEMLELVKLANEVKPYAVSMVDTYGLMHQDNLKQYFDLLDANLDKKIALGYHAHNNFQMGYANCITMMSQVTDRDLLVDGTVYGMGKSAGNAPIELIAMWMNHNIGEKYIISQYLEAVDSNIMPIFRKIPWGYNMFYYLAASNDCHPNYVSYLMDKRTLSVKSINDILKRLQGEKRLLYDEEYIEQLYQEYQNIEIDDMKDVNRLKEIMSGRKILALGPGPNIALQSESVIDYIKNNNPIVISINFIPDICNCDFLFLTNSKRYVQLASTLSSIDVDIEIISTSNVTKNSGSFEYTLNYGELVDENAKVKDNPLFMLLKVLKQAGVKDVALAGFDGYRGGGQPDYIERTYEYYFDAEKAQELNLYMKKNINTLQKDMDIVFVTRSMYEK